MKFRLTTTFASACALAALVAWPVQADSRTSYDTWDTNKDGHVSTQEFNERWSHFRVYQNRDIDRNGRLSQTEFNDPHFATMDADGNGVITEDEFSGGTFSRYDVNNDGMLGLAEWESFENDAEAGGWLIVTTTTVPATRDRSGLTVEQRRLEMNNLYSAWDRNQDDVLSKEEFENGLAETGFKPEGDLFQRYDVNSDQLIGHAEWDSFKDDAEINDWLIIVK